MGFPTSPSEGEEHTTLLGTVYKYTNIPAGEDKWYIINADINLNDLTEKNHVSLAAKNGEADVQHLTAAQVAAIGIDDIQLNVERLAAGTIISTWTSIPMAGMPAADQNCEINYVGHAPAGMTAMVNPNLIISFSGAGADTWTLDIKANSAGHGDAQGSNLHNGAENLTAGAGATFYRKTVALVGTISPSDVVGMRIKKTSSDAQILYITMIAWIERA